MGGRKQDVPQPLREVNFSLLCLCLCFLLEFLKLANLCVHLVNYNLVKRGFQNLKNPDDKKADNGSFSQFYIPSFKFCFIYTYFKNLKLEIDGPKTITLLAVNILGHIFMKRNT